MNTDNKDLRIAASVVITIILFITFYLALTRVDKFFLYKGIDDCAKTSRQEQTLENGKVAYPLSDIYETCLDRKGIK